MGKSWGVLWARASLAVCSIVLTLTLTTQAAVPVMVVDTTVPAPGGATFTGFDAPTFFRFAATWTGGGTGALRLTGTPSIYEVIASNDTAIPGGTGSFTGFRSPDQILGHATGVNQEGIYRLNSPSNVSRFFDRNTPIPNGAGNFTSFGQHPIGQQNGAFYGEGSGGQSGIYRYVNFNPANVFRVVDRNMNFPGSAEPFTQFSEPFASNFGGDILYVARSATRRGVFRIGDPSTPMFDTTTPVPNGAPGETFTDFEEATVTSVPALLGRSATRAGVYWMDSFPSPVRVADTTMLIPGGTGTFTDFEVLNAFAGDLASAKPNVTFLGHGVGGQKGIYGSELFQFGTRTELGKIIAVGDTLDGKVIVDLAMTNQSQFFQQLRFRANFADGSSGIYLVQVPEPTSVCMLLPLTAVMWRRSCRTHSV
ncbi:MAG: hypothetical protein H7Z14_01195 [Anaerolineae bacterium]|nr:hypothetical protein [Phycisphaerae bacterium]